jgi:regulator of protease activity HflC (stomatin/prohibitin superfamily)
MISLTSVYAASAVLLLYLMAATKIAGESQRFAVFKLGRFQDFRGPGIVLIAPAIQKVHRLSVGDIGVIVGPGLAQFVSIDIPLQNIDSLREGQTVRIERFDGVEPRVVASSLPRKDMCPNCGHVF